LARVSARRVDTRPGSLSHRYSLAARRLLAPSIIPRGTPGQRPGQQSQPARPSGHAGILQTAARSFARLAVRHWRLGRRAAAPGENYSALGQAPARHPLSRGWPPPTSPASSVGGSSENQLAGVATGRDTPRPSYLAQLTVPATPQA